MGRARRNYEKEYKEQAVKLAKEIGAEKAARELGVPKGTLYGWMKALREGRLEAGPGSRTPNEAMSLAEEMMALRQQMKVLERENRRRGVNVLPGSGSEPAGVLCISYPAKPVLEVPGVSSGHAGNS